MKSLFFFLFSFASLLYADQQELIDRIFEERDPKAFETAFTEAAKAGVPKQALVEARFLYLVDSGDQAKLAAYAPVLKEQLKAFSIDDSIIFAVPEDFQAIVEYVYALAALEKKDTKSFKKHITEAFWLSPAQAAIFGKLIDDVRLQEKMNTLVIDFSRTLESQIAEVPSAPLQKHLGEAPAILLHFWSPWARESTESMNDFHATAAVLKKNNLPVVSVLLTGTAESRQDADIFVKEHKDKTDAPWLVDSSKKALGSLLRIQAFPTVALLSKEGRVLFNGHPANPAFWSELQRINPKITRPAAPEKPQDLPQNDE